MKLSGKTTPSQHGSHKNIPEFISNYYERTGKNKIPNARIKHTKVVGKVDIYLYV